MLYRRGFTIVEIVVVMVIMVILLGLAVLNISATQANARDAERKADVENIARGLETRYKQGNPVVTSDSNTSSGTYPSVNEWRHMNGDDRSAEGFVPAQVADGYAPQNIPGTTMASFVPPTYEGAGISGTAPVCTAACGTAEGEALLDTLFNSDAKKLRYYYEPVAADNTVCINGPCVRFNLYYWSETKNKRETIKSKHQ